MRESATTLPYLLKMLRTDCQRKMACVYTYKKVKCLFLIQDTTANKKKLFNSNAFIVIFLSNVFGVFYQINFW